MTEDASTPTAANSGPPEANKAFLADVDVELELWPGASHVFQLVEFLPEARLAIDHIVRFVRTRAGWPDVGGPAETN